VTLSSAVSAVVVDATAAVDFVIGREPWADRWEEWARSMTLRLAPVHFRAEVANALLRSTRLESGQIPLRLARIAQSGVDTTDRGWHGLIEAIELATRHHLSVYDALYLQLAMDIEAPLATRDGQLASAARAEGIEVIGESG
jgi:predicted nucleic acid-binding protein